MFADKVLPTVGSSGTFVFRAPFDTLAVEGVRYTCQAIRRFSDYAANNDDPKKEIYDKYNLSEEDYNSDRDEDSYIVSLQSAKGHWLYVPARYIVTYPLVNGIPYRTLSIVTSLPAIEVDRDLSHIVSSITDTITDYLGVDAAVRLVDTSQVILVTKQKHDEIQLQRNIAIQNTSTDSSRYRQLLQDHQEALDKIAILETWILDHQ